VPLTDCGHLYLVLREDGDPPTSLQEPSSEATRPR
jgi:hypothetical protein